MRVHGIPLLGEALGSELDDLRPIATESDLEVFVHAVDPAGAEPFHMFVYYTFVGGDLSVVVEVCPREGEVLPLELGQLRCEEVRVAPCRDSTRAVVLVDIEYVPAVAHYVLLVGEPELSARAEGVGRNSSPRTAAFLARTEEYPRGTVLAVFALYKLQIPPERAVRIIRVERTAAAVIRGAYDRLLAMAGVDVPDAHTLRLLALLADPEPPVGTELDAERIFERVFVPRTYRTPPALPERADRLEIASVHGDNMLPAVTHRKHAVFAHSESAGVFCRVFEHCFQSLRHRVEPHNVFVAPKQQLAVRHLPNLPGLGHGNRVERLFRFCIRLLREVPDVYRVAFAEIRLVADHREGLPFRLRLHPAELIGARVDFLDAVLEAVVGIAFRGGRERRVEDPVPRAPELVEVFVALDESVRGLAHRGDIHEIAHAHDRLRREMVGEPSAAAGAGVVPRRLAVRKRRRVEASAIGERVIWNPHRPVRVFARSEFVAVDRVAHIPIDSARALLKRFRTDRAAHDRALRVADLDRHIAAFRHIDRYLDGERHERNDDKRQRTDGNN